MEQMRCTGNSVESLELHIQDKGMMSIKAGGSIGSWSWRILYVRLKNIDSS